MVYHHYDYMLVLLSYIVSVLGSFTALKITANLAMERDHRQRRRSLVVASVVMGVGAIWAMHFIAMLALKMPVAVSYNLGLTSLSALVAAVACLIGLSMTSRGDYSRLNLLTAGTYMGIGVASMHYMGMAAMQMPATTVYNGAITTLSIVIAIVASVAALKMAYRRNSTWQTLLGSMVMGVAVCGMHYTGMAAAHFVLAGQAAASDASGVDTTAMGLVVFAVVTVLLAGVLVGVLRQRREFAFSS